MNTKIFLFSVLFLAVFSTGYAQIAINTTGAIPDASAGLDVSFSNKGVLIPRIALSANNVTTPVTSPADGLLIYNTATAGTSPNNVVPGYYYWSSSSGIWKMLYSGTVPSIPGNTEFWIRPTSALYIQPIYNAYARVYDNGQSYGFVYDGSNANGGLFAGGSCGAMGTRGSSSDIPNWTSDIYPFVDAGSDNAINGSDNLTWTGLYGWGSAYIGTTGACNLDAGVRGIGLGGSSGTNSSWPVVGVEGEVIATGSSANGQQGVYGWQAAPAGSAPVCIGVVGRTSQTGNQSGGVVGYYTNSVGNLTTCFTSFQSMGLLGTSSFGAMGQTSVVGGLGVFGVNTDLTSSSNVGVQGQVGNGTSISADFKGVVGISNNTNDLWGYGGYFQGEYYGVYAYNPTATAGYAVYYSGNLAGSGSKSCIMKTSKGPKALYCVESPENYFEDYGTAQLLNGKTKINIDPLFMETITFDNENPYKVFIQLTDEIPNNVHIVKYDTYFEVVENNNGTSNASFDWRLVAKRKGYEKLRLNDAPEAYTDPALYPDPNDPSIPVQWRKKVKDNFEFMEKTKHTPVQKYETAKTSNIDKKAIEEKQKK